MVKHYAKKTIEKQNKLVFHQNINDTTQRETTIRTCDQAETFMGGAFIVSVINYADGIAKAMMPCFLVHVRQNQAPTSIGTTDGSDGYLPESDVLWSGLWLASDADGYSDHRNFKIKTKRKFKRGDTLRFILKQSSVNAHMEFAGFLTCFWGN